MLAAGAGLDAEKLVLDRIVDRLVVADLEMQERVVLNRAPVPAVERIRADEIDGAGDPAAVAFSHHQQDAVRHLLADHRIERAREIGPSPLARSGFHVELEKGVPRAFGEVGAGQPMHGDSIRQRIVALAPDGLAFAGGERSEKVLESSVARVLPVELAVRALEIAMRAEKLPFRLGREG